MFISQLYTLHTHSQRETRNPIHWFYYNLCDVKRCDVFQCTLTHSLIHELTCRSVIYTICIHSYTANHILISLACVIFFNQKFDVFGLLKFNISNEVEQSKKKKQTKTKKKPNSIEKVHATLNVWILESPVGITNVLWLRCSHSKWNKIK